MIVRFGPLTIGDVSLGTSQGLAALDKLATLMDVILKSPFGLLASKEVLLTQINGLFGAQASLQASLKNPAEYFKQLLSLYSTLAKTAALSLGSAVRDLTPQIKGNLAAIGALQTKLASLRGLIDTSSLGRLAALAVFADLQSKLSSGGLALYVAKDATLPVLVGQLQADVAGGLPPGFSGTSPAYGVFLVAENPGTITALKLLFLAP